MKKLPRNILIGLGFTIVTCCGGWWWAFGYHDVTGNPGYPTDFKAGALYSLQKEVFILEDSSDAKIKLYLSQQDNPGGSHFGVLPAGARLRFEKLLYHFYFEDESTFPVMRVMDGPCTGKDVAALELVRHTNNHEAYLDPAFIKALPAE